MKLLHIDFQNDKVTTETLATARKNGVFKTETRYVSADSWKNLKGIEEWMECYCHCYTDCWIPTKALNKISDVFEMIVYYHESIAFGDFGTESVAFEFDNDKLEKEYTRFLQNKYMEEKVTPEILRYFSGDVYSDIADYCQCKGCDCKDKTECDCEYECKCFDYYLDEFCRENRGSYRGGAEVSSRDLKEYILQKIQG